MINSPLIAPQDLWQRLLKDDVTIIDVRAQVEFSAGSIPSSVNHPILNNEERTLVGTAYKQEGSQQAVALGHQLISGEVKEARVQAWVREVQKNPERYILTCFRGGMRSQISQTWLAEAGYALPRVAGGYKKMRQFLIEQTEQFCLQEQLVVLTGNTGAGKTQFLQKIQNQPIINLEFLAKHRGSAFGAYQVPQPTQIDFENALALALGKAQRQFPQRRVLVEDESRMIGRCVQPENFFNLLRQSPVLFLDEPLEVRIENTLQEYVILRLQDSTLFASLEASLEKIKNKLGGLRYSEILHDMRSAQKAWQDHQDSQASRVWIEKMIQWYYDPSYESSLQKRDFKILYRGDQQQLQTFIESQMSSSDFGR